MAARKAARKAPARPAARPAPVARPVETPSSSSSSNSAPETTLVSATMEEIISGLVQVRASLSSSLSELSAKQTAEASRLQELRNEIETTVRQIRELHGAEVKDDSLSTIIAQHQAAAEAHQKTLAEKQEAFDIELTNARKEWEKEKENRARSVAEDNEAFNKVLQRENQEYTYLLQQKRDLDKDAYEHQKKHAEAELSDFQAKKKKEWDDREKAIADLEKLYAEAKAKVDEFPAKLEAATKKAREEGKGIAINQAKIEADLLAKEIEGEKRLSDLKIKSLEDSIKEHSGRIEVLAKKLSDAVAQAQGLAIKSIEGASNASSFMAVKEIALEQAKNTPKNKLSQEVGGDGAPSARSAEGRGDQGPLCAQRRGGCAHSAALRCAEAAAVSAALCCAAVAAVTRGVGRG